jgi:hypothetical protein
MQCVVGHAARWGVVDSGFAITRGEEISAEGTLQPIAILTRDVALTSDSRPVFLVSAAVPSGARARHSCRIHSLT